MFVFRHGLTIAMVLLFPAYCVGSIVTYQEGVNGYAGTQDVQLHTKLVDDVFDLNILQNDIADNDPTNFWQPLVRFDNISYPAKPFSRQTLARWWRRRLGRMSWTFRWNGE